MDGRNGKWVNVDYTTHNLLDESYAYQRPDGYATLLDNANGSGGSTAANGRSHALEGVHSSLDDGDQQQQEQSIQITVSEPVKQGEGMNAYISYKISTVTSRPQFTKTSFSVIRRYSDFIWLHGNLYAMYPGVVVPPLPEKLLVGRFSPEFVESRRRALQLFLHRCCAHPELQHSEHLTTFLEASDDALQVFRADPKNTAGGGALRGSIFQWIDDTVSTISSTLGSNGATLDKTPADLEVDEMMAYIDGLEPIITGLHKHAHGLTTRAREIADGLFEFGVSFTLLGKSEENPSLQEGLSHIGDCADKLATLAAEHAEREAVHFEEPIFDYIRLVGAVKAALQKRNEVRNAYATAVADLEAKTTVVNKMLKNKGFSEEKIQLAEGDVMRAQQRVDDAKLEYDIVTERVMREVDRFKREKLSDFKRIILDYIQLQIEYSKKVEDEWNRVLPRLSEIHVEAISSPGASATANSLIQEDYIPSDGGRVTNNLAGLSLDENDEDELDDLQRYHLATVNNPDVAL